MLIKQVLPRWTERAPRRALRRRQRPSSALPRRWRSSARRSTSRCSSSYLCGSAAVTYRPGLLLQSVHAPDRDCDGCTYYADAAACRSGPEPVKKSTSTTQRLLCAPNRAKLPGGPSARRGARGGGSNRGGTFRSADARARGACQAGAQLAVHVRQQGCPLHCPSLSFCALCVQQTVKPLCMPYLAAKGLVG